MKRLEINVDYLALVSQCDPMDDSPPGSSVHGIFQARILEWVRQIPYHWAAREAQSGFAGVDYDE